MDAELLGMLVLFVLALSTGIAGLIFFPSAWSPVFASVAGVSGIGLGVTGYALSKQ